MKLTIEIDDFDRDQPGCAERPWSATLRWVDDAGERDDLGAAGIGDTVQEALSNLLRENTSEDAGVQALLDPLRDQLIAAQDADPMGAEVLAHPSQLGEQEPTLVLTVDTSECDPGLRVRVNVNDAAVADLVPETGRRFDLETGEPGEETGLDAALAEALEDRADFEDEKGDLADAERIREAAQVLGEAEMQDRVWDHVLGPMLDDLPGKLLALRES